MNSNSIGILVSLAYVALILGLMTLLQRKCKLSGKAGKKAVHILLGNWVFIAVYYFTSPVQAAILPFLAIIMNVTSAMTGAIKVIECKGDRTLGTVWYAVSLTVLIMFALSLEKPYIAVGALLTMAYGDGFSAIVGSKWGSVTYPEKFGQKTLEGSLVMFTVTVLINGLIGFFYLPVFFVWAALACGFIGMLLELLTSNGYDNLTVPLGIGVLLYLFSFDALTGMVLNSVLTIFILFIAWVSGSLTARSCLTSYLMATVLFLFGGWIIYSAMILFAVLGSGISKLGNRKKASATALHERKGARSSVQILSNAFPAVILTMIGYTVNNEVIQLAAFATFSGAAADTFSSEIGMLSKKQPRSILTMKPLKSGLSGGITILGLFSGLAGSFSISLLTLHNYSAVMFLRVWLFGFFATIIDSLLGQTVQVKYSSNGRLTEQKSEEGAMLERVSGWSWMTNDAVNILSLGLTGVLFILAFNQ